MGELGTSLDSLELAFSQLFSVLPSGWGEVLSSAFVIFILFAIFKIALDVIGSFF